jgi:hypothetical protein
MDVSIEREGDWRTVYIYAKEDGNLFTCLIGFGIIAGGSGGMPGGSGVVSASAGEKSSEEHEPEVGSISGSEGINTEESSNSSSLPWNVSSRQQQQDQQENEANSEEGREVDSMQSEHLPRADLNHESSADNDNLSAQAVHAEQVGLKRQYHSYLHRVQAELK